MQSLRYDTIEEVMNILPSLIRSHHFLSHATLISDNSAVSVPELYAGQISMTRPDPT